MNSPITNMNPSPKHKKETIIENSKKNLQSKKHYVAEFQITKEGFEIIRI
jgi:hypothetical protein